MIYLFADRSNYMTIAAAIILRQNGNRILGNRAKTDIDGCGKENRIKSGKKVKIIAAK